jgi:hypothetical protein
MGGGNSDQRRVFIATAHATQRERRIAAAFAAGSFVVFLAVVPFVRVPLPASPAFIPAYEAALLLIDLITAALLFDQSVRLRSLAVATLASGYLFDAVMIVPHALTFPGAFAPTGMLGAGEQTTAWLYVFWHGGFPLFVIAYAVMRARESTGDDLPPRVSVREIGAAVAGVVALAIALTLLATRGQDLLPVVMRGGDYSLLVTRGVSPAVWVLTLLAIVSLWKRRKSVLNLWLMLVMWVWLFDIALSAVIGSHRFDLGFYAGRLFGLIAASFVLIMLLLEMARMYAGLVEAAVSAERRIASLTRAATRPDPGKARGGDTDSFVVHQTIEHYRDLLESGELDEARRRTIERLLAEEEAKLTKAR